MDLHLGVVTDGAQLLLQVDDALDVMWLEGLLVSHDVVVGADEVFLELIVKGLPGDLNADTEYNLNIDDLLLKSCIQNSQVPLPRLFDRVILLILRRHDFVQVDLIVEKVVILQTAERF